MWKTKLCLGIFGNGDDWELNTKEQIALFKQVGFDGFFSGWYPGYDIKAIREYADEMGMIYQSIHAPFGRMADMWKEGPEAEVAVNELLDCLKDCAANNVPIMVCHCFIGHGYHETNEIGVKNFTKVVKRAQELGVKVAFENCELEQFLALLMESFKDYDCVGFCWDTGHEMCYNHSADMMALYGDRLICTHLNDNLGIRSEDGGITWLDDLHLLPFDGVADWNNITQRLNKHGYDGILTFELLNVSKPGRHENDLYKNMGPELYVTEAFKRACRVAVLKQQTLFEKE